MIFVSVLGPSSYTYAEATWSQELENWEGEALKIMEDEVNMGWWDAQLFDEFRQMLKQSSREKRRFWKELLWFAPSESSALLAAQTGQLKLR